MNTLGDQITAILTAIIGVAILAVILSRNSDTSNVIRSAAQGFSDMLGTAVSPITGGASSIGPMTGFAGSRYNNMSIPSLRGMSYN